MSPTSHPARDPASDPAAAGSGGSGGDTFFTSDPHFTHVRILESCSRPYASIQEMDDDLIARWNAVVRPRDIVWVLGDYGDHDRALAYLPSLNGRKRLVTGNHDRAWVGRRSAHRYTGDYLDAGFELVTPWARARLAGQDVLLSHFPYTGDHTPEDRYPEYRLPDVGKWLIHGHVHNEWKVNGRQINVGVDVWDYTPVAAGALEAIITAAG